MQDNIKDKSIGYRKYVTITPKANITCRCHAMVPEKMCHMEKLREKIFFVCVLLF